MNSDKVAGIPLSAGNKARASVLLGLVAASAGGGCTTADQQAMAAKMNIRVTELTPAQAAQIQQAYEQQNAASGTESGGDATSKADPASGGGGSTPNTDPNGLPI